MSTPIPPEWRDGNWRYQAEVANTIVAIMIAQTAYKVLDSTITYVYKSEAKLKGAASKSASDALADNLRKALDSADKSEPLGERVANFTLSSQWTPKGYFCCGPRVVSFEEGMRYNSRINVRVKYNVYECSGTLEGKKDKDKNKDKEEIIIIAPEESPKKVVFNEKILQNATITQGDGKPPQLGWGTKLDISAEIGAGHDGDPHNDGGLYYEFRIYWNETCATASFSDLVWIKCYATGKVEASASFYDACDSADAVLKALSADGTKSTQFTEDAAFVKSDTERARRANAARAKERTEKAEAEQLRRRRRTEDSLLLDENYNEYRIDYY